MSNKSVILTTHRPSELSSWFHEPKVYSCGYVSPFSFRTKQANYTVLTAHRLQVSEYYTVKSKHVQFILNIRTAYFVHGHHDFIGWRFQLLVGVVYM
jgi:hypothetical protein